jgi:hypothetical protein
MQEWFWYMIALIYLMIGFVAIGLFDSPLAVFLWPIEAAVVFGIWLRKHLNKKL